MIADINNIFKSQKLLGHNVLKILFSWAYKIAQWITVLGTKLDDLRSILEPTWRKKITDSCKLLSNLHIHAHLHQTHKINKCN